MFRLVIQDDEGKTTVVPLIRDEITIGRKEGNTIRLTERNVSRRHARIIRQNNEVQIEDLGSYNGIRVNNARIAERVSLRISDQVQIGDYKLYLKAEGVEQVDDARTMPIERIDNPLQTDVMPVQGPPTQPIAPAAIAAAAAANGTATPPPGAVTSGLAGAQLIGNPNRTMVAIADTDPAGRPVATAATVAALTHVAGYGKLVALSSNFAKQEWELSRPQMIIGRTDENDIVINHRSISRNHAKLVREPETGRYTISDLQSSNGVRVNGQDYGKVELRRGDVIDLGHVRLRFVEPGEDFLFDRDAQITDVPDGSKKGLWIALIFGALVVIGIIVFVMTRGGDKPTGGENGSNGGLTKGSGAQVAMGATDADTGSDTTQPATNPGSGSGSGSAEPQITNTVPDAATGSATPATNTDEALTQCVELQRAHKWVDLQTCANGIAAAHPKESKAFIDKATNEQKAQLNYEAEQTAIRDDNLKEAARLANKIPNDSDYHADAKKAYDDFERKFTDEAVKRGQAAAAAGKCKDLNVMIGQAQSAVIERALKRIPCDDPNKVVVKQGSGTPAGGGSATVTPPANNCSASDIQGYKDKGAQDLGAGQDSAALREFEKAQSCKYDASLFPRLVLAACKSGNEAKAKAYYGKCGAACATLVARCQSYKINLP